MKSNSDTNIPQPCRWSRPTLTQSGNGSPFLVYCQLSNTACSTGFWNRIRPAPAAVQRSLKPPTVTRRAAPLPRLRTWCTSVRKANCGQYNGKQTDWAPEFLARLGGAHWAQGWVPNVAAEPLQNEPLAEVLPTGNVSRPAMWNPFQLEGTGEQSHCLETQLSVLGLFFPSGPHSVEDTNLHHTTPRECARRSKKDHHVLNSLASSDLLPSARGIWGPKTKQRWLNTAFLPQIIHGRKFCLLRRSAGSPRLSWRNVCLQEHQMQKTETCCSGLGIGVCQLSQMLSDTCALSEIPQWQQINPHSRTVCSAAERGVPKLNVSKANLNNLNDSRTWLNET